jgi:NAD(P)-dependent dehydrogenase (short-subunit alcohol dehydrogenase family)
VDGLNGKVAIVTGGASGLGATLCRAFAAAGTRVVIADIMQPQAQRLQEEIGPASAAVKTDLRSDEDIDRLVAATERQFGGLDFVVNLACSYAEAGVQSSRQQWQAVFDINLFGHALLIQKAVPLLKRSASASVVNFSSASGRIAQMSRWVYPATKAAIEQMTRSAALELAEHGIRVNSLIPGMIAKQPHEYASLEAAERIGALAARSNVLSRLQQPGEVAETVLFLCSSHARFMTGSTLVADGGYTTLGPLGRERHVPQRHQAS